MNAFTPLPDEVALQSGNVAARFSPWGASLTELRVDGRSIIEHVSSVAAKYSFAGLTLAPWPNRLRDGKYSFAGQDFAFENLDDKSNANHGLVFDRKFEISSKTDDRISFTLKLGGDAGYPFKIKLDVGYHLTANGIESSITAFNLGEVDAPIAFGAHPYIVAEADSRIDINAAIEMVNDERQIPVGQKVATKNRSADGSTLRFESLEIDDCFAELARDATAKATTTVTHADGSVVAVWQDHSFKYLMVFAHHALDRLGMQHSAIAIEPQTAPANALASGQDLFVLESHQEKTATWGVTFSNKTQES